MTVKLAEIKEVEIFSTGRWKGSKAVEVTESMLDDMVTAFMALSSIEGFRPPLKLGHADAQTLVGQGGSGAPALGWVTRIWRSGNKVLADFADVPSTLVDLIRRRLYNSVSIELLPTLEYGGTNFRNVLSAVAILGAELPAVKGLKALSASLFDAAGDPVVFSEKEEEIDMAGEAGLFKQEQVDALIDAAVKKAVDAVRTEFAAQLAEKDKALNLAAEAVKKAGEDATRAQTALDTFRADQSNIRVTDAVDAAIERGAVLPAERDGLVAFGQGMSATTKIKFGDKEITLLDQWLADLAKRPAAVDFSEHGKGKGEGDRKPGGKADAQVDRLAKAIVGKSAGKTTYSAAVQEVLDNPDNAELKARYAAGE